MPYLFDGEVIPNKVLIQNKALMYTGIVSLVVACLYVFVEEPFSLKVALFATFCVFMAVAALLMVVALRNIRARFLKQGQE